MSKDRFIIVNASNKPVCEGVVVEFWRTDATLRIENGLGVLKTLEERNIIKFMFMQRRRGIFEAVITSITGNELTVEIVKTPKASEKEDVRVETDFETRVFEKDEENFMYAYPVQIGDMSAGGVLIYSNVKLPMMKIFEIAIPCNTDYVIVNMNIIREDKLKEDSEFKYSYGCKFDELTNVEENMIRGMVFKIAARKAGGRK